VEVQRANRNCCRRNAQRRSSRQRGASVVKPPGALHTRTNRLGSGTAAGRRRAGTTAPAAKDVKLLKSCLLQAVPEAVVHDGRHIVFGSVPGARSSHLVSQPSSLATRAQPPRACRWIGLVQSSTMVAEIARHSSTHAASRGAAPTQPRAKYVSQHPR
jgi:hypothetical protein